MALAENNGRKFSWYVSFFYQLTPGNILSKITVNQEHLDASLTAIGISDASKAEFFEILRSVIVRQTSEAPTSEADAMAKIPNKSDRPELLEVAERLAHLKISLRKAGLPDELWMIVGKPYAFVTYRSCRCAEILCGTVEAVTFDEDLCLETNVEYHGKGVRLVRLQWLGDMGQWQGIVELPADSEVLYRLNVERLRKNPHFGYVRGHLTLEMNTQSGDSDSKAEKRSIGFRNTKDDMAIS